MSEWQKDDDHDTQDDYDARKAEHDSAVEWTKDRETCERVARALAGNAVREWDRLSDWAKERYLSDAQVVLAELERDNAAEYAKGWEDAKRMAVEAVENRQGDEESCLTWTLAVDAIRAIEPGKVQRTFPSDTFRITSGTVEPPMGGKP
jgi:outer membrane cobalamin receptor